MPLHGEGDIGGNGVRGGGGLYIALGHWKAGLALYVTLDQRGDGEIGEVTDEEKGGVSVKYQTLQCKETIKKKKRQ